MNPFRHKPQHRTQTSDRQLLARQNLHPHESAAAERTADCRQFALQPIVSPGKQHFASEALFRNESDNRFAVDPNIAARIMLDNWLLYGFEELAGGRAVFLHCTRETLLSGLLSLLPRSAVFQILESVRPDDEVLSACRTLKDAGYRFALDDFESPENMEAFLDLADFIKVDFQNCQRRKRACMLRDLKLTQATLIADKIESEEDFHQAVEDGFELFRGSWVGESINYEKKADPLDPMKCTCIFGALEEPVFAAEELAELVQLESGIECRLLRRANWASAPGVVINSTRDAFEVVGKAGLQKIVKLAMIADSEGEQEFQPVPRRRNAVSYYGADALVRWMEMGARPPWWFDAGQGRVL